VEIIRGKITADGGLELHEAPDRRPSAADGGAVGGADGGGRLKVEEEFQLT